MSKVQIREEAIELFKLNAIDIQELLNRMDWPDRKNVVKRMNAGPMGMLIERLGEIGAPEQVLELMHEVSQMDEKEFKMALHYEDIPPFMAVVQNQEGGDPMQELEMGEKEINIQKTQAEIQKIQLESALLEAKIATEQVDQQVKMSGVQFDQENLKIKKAELVSEMGNQQHAQKMDKANFVSGMAEKQSKDEVERKKVDVAEKAAVSNAKQKGTPPYREKGAKSNNKKTGGK